VTFFSEATDRKVSVVNDADAAGCAEMAFGAGRGQKGLVIMVTLGTGIGTALFIDGRLVPNTELGHLTLRGRDAERWAAASVRERNNLSWEAWARRLDAYLHLLHGYFWPDLFIIGGGVSKKADRYLSLLTIPEPVVAARLRNDAGIIGAALAFKS
jgi:polyphosphate glucokinase